MIVDLEIIWMLIVIVLVVFTVVIWFFQPIIDRILRNDHIPKLRIKKKKKKKKKDDLLLSDFLKIIADSIEVYAKVYNVAKTVNTLMKKEEEKKIIDGMDYIFNNRFTFMGNAKVPYRGYSKKDSIDFFKKRVEEK